MSCIINQAVIELLEAKDLRTNLANSRDELIKCSDLLDTANTTAQRSFS